MAMPGSPLESYAKVNEPDQDWFAADARYKTMLKRILVASLSIVVLVVVIVSAVVGTVRSRSGGAKSNGEKIDHSHADTIKAACGMTLYPDSCYLSFSPLLSSTQDGTTIQPVMLYKESLKVAITELSNVAKYFTENGGLRGVLDASKSEGAAAAIKDCRELVDLAVDSLNSSLSSGDLTSFEAIDDDQATSLCASCTYQGTCIDGFDNTTLRPTVLQIFKNSTEFTSNALAMIKQVSNAANSLNHGRKLLTTRESDMPHWFSLDDRKLLQSSETNLIKFDLVVAKDGTGNYMTIGEALKAVPDKSMNRFTIYVKAGVYYENVSVEKEQWNVTMIGDGKNRTVVSGSLNVVDYAIKTYSTATFAAIGPGFNARDMGFHNTAGAIKYQAVALLSNSDRSIFYPCVFDGFQDSLYAHANRQFYRECDIYGTVDFIFGNSAVIFQNCNILPRKPMPGQQNTITAQGKCDPNCRSGISIQNCTIAPAEDLTSVRTFLGRPWKPYSTTIFMNTMMGSLIDPGGWMPWTGTRAPDTVYYAEYQNYGPGSWTKNRVKWKGLRSITMQEASEFTVDSFINGSQWIGDSGVPYKGGL